MTEQFRIEPLSSEHDRSRFSSGSAPLDRYLREQAWQERQAADRVMFCSRQRSDQGNCRFYTLTAAGIALTALSPEIAKKLPRYPVVPAALLGRLAVAQRYQGKGLGGDLLGNAVLRIARAELGVFALLADAKDEAAQRFYEHYGFTVVPGADRRLCLPISLALRQFEGRPEHLA